MISRLSSHRALSGRVGALAATCAVSLALAACGSSSNSSSSSSSTSTTNATIAVIKPATSGPGVGKPAVTIGDKTFSEEYILGQLYTQALEAKGYRINLHENIGSSEIIFKAIKSGAIDMYPEYTGTLLSAVAGQTKEPASAAAAYTEAKAYVQKYGLTL